jgi:hypothetical protein
MKNKILEKVHL